MMWLFSKKIFGIHQRAWTAGFALMRYGQMDGRALVRSIRPCYADFSFCIISRRKSFKMLCNEVGGSTLLFGKCGLTFTPLAVCMMAVTTSVGLLGHSVGIARTYCPFRLPMRCTLYHFFGPFHLCTFNTDRRAVTHTGVARHNRCSMYFTMNMKGFEFVPVWFCNMCNLLYFGLNYMLIIIDKGLTMSAANQQQV